MIDINTVQIKKVEERLGRYKAKAPIVLYRALNRAVQNAKTNARKNPRETYNIKAKDIKETLTAKKASRSKLGAALVSQGTKVPLDKFRISPKQLRPKKPPRALKVAVKKGGLKQLLGAFVADIRGNKVFSRVSKRRLPINRLFGPAIPQMIDNKAVRPFIEKEAINTFQRRLDHEIKRVLEG